MKVKGGVRCEIALSTKKWLQFSSVTQSCPTLCDPMNFNRMLSMPPCPNVFLFFFPNVFLIHLI